MPYKTPGGGEIATLPRTITVNGITRYTSRMTEAEKYAAGYKRIVDVTAVADGIQRAATFADEDTGVRIERTYDLEPIPAPDLGVIFRAKQAEIRDQADAFLAPYRAEYGVVEMATWDQQYAEAQALQADAEAAAPLVRSIAAARGMAVGELAGRIVANRATWMVLSGHVIGQRLAYQDSLDAAYAAQDLAAMQAIEPVYELPED